MLCVERPAGRRDKGRVRVCVRVCDAAARVTGRASLTVYEVKRLLTLPPAAHTAHVSHQPASCTRGARDDMDGLVMATATIKLDQNWCVYLIHSLCFCTHVSMLLCLTLVSSFVRIYRLIFKKSLLLIVIC